MKRQSNRAIPACLGAMALMLAGCDSGGVPSPADRLAGETSQSADAVNLDLVTLRTDGVTAGSESFYFAAGRAEVVAALTRILGEPVASAEMRECGAGPIDSDRFAGGLIVNFQNGYLAGWNLDEASEKIAVTGDVAIGTERAVVTAAPGFSAIEASTLGEEFVLGNSLGGFLAQDKVSMLYAGTQCFFR